MSNGEPELTYRVSYTQALTELKDEISKMASLQAVMKEDLRRALDENKELKSRVRSLELRFYGILAGLVTAAVLLYTKGGVTIS